MTRTKQILSMMVDGEYKTKAQLAEALGVTGEPARRAISRLLASGCIEKVPAVYVVTERGVRFLKAPVQTPPERIKQISARRRIRRLAAKADPTQPNHFLVGDVPNSVFSWR